MNSHSSATPWYQVSDAATIRSPALLIYRERLDQNLQQMLAIARDPSRLRPHLKTHKLREIVKLQLDLGITKFKCATIAEAEMAASAGAPDVLLAYQPVGPNVSRLCQLLRVFSQTKFSVICDNATALGEIARGVHSSFGGDGFLLEILMDLDIGQQRTGISPGPEAVRLYHLIAASPGLKPGGLHAYDGHIADGDPAKRTSACDAAFAPVAALVRELEATGLPVPRVVAGGTPTFPIHARRRAVECSPGTCVFWDAGYGSKLSDLPFVPAAVLLTRVVSQPNRNRLCLDLGHKAVASEMPQPRVRFLNLDEAHPVMHSEEHLVVETPQADQFKLGDCLYAVPWHICPTVALHSEVVVIEHGRTTGSWKVVARERRLTI